MQKAVAIQCQAIEEVRGRDETSRPNIKKLHLLQDVMGSPTNQISFFAYKKVSSIEIFSPPFSHTLHVYEQYCISLEINSCPAVSTAENCRCNWKLSWGLPCSHQIWYRLLLGVPVDNRISEYDAAKFTINDFHPQWQLATTPQMPIDPQLTPHLEEDKINTSSSNRITIMEPISIIGKGRPAAKRKSAQSWHSTKRLPSSFERAEIIIDAQQSRGSRARALKNEKPTLRLLKAEQNGSKLQILQKLFSTAPIRK